MRLLAESRIGIDCAADKVWQATIDVENWPIWTPTVTAAVRLDDGPFGPGSEARLTQPGQAETVWRVTDNYTVKKRPPMPVSRSARM
jgi:Polyketide cyclase / dehydrase and lipid transport